MALTVISLVLDAGVTPPGSASYPYFAAAQNGLVSALCTCLLINGFVGFQLYEDGTALSVWLLRFCSLAMFIVSGAVSLLTFKDWAGLSHENPVGVFVITYIINAIMLFVYLCSQILLVVGTLEDRWPLGDITFGVFFFVIGQVILYVFSDTICSGVSHYLDGLFFATICNLLAVMMVYKVRYCRHLLASHKLTLASTGTPSLVKISNSRSASNHTTGKSRNSSQRKTSEAQCTMSLNMLSPSTTSHTTAHRTTQTWVIDVRILNFFSISVIRGTFLLRRLHGMEFGREARQIARLTYMDSSGRGRREWVLDNGKTTGFWSDHDDIDSSYVYSNSSPN